MSRSADAEAAAPTPMATARRRIRAAGLMAGVLLLALNGSAWAVPPAPPPPDVAKLAERLTTLFNTRDYAGYAALMSDTVKVYDGERMIAADKAQWMAEVRKEAAANVHVRPLETAASPEGVLVAEVVSDIAPPSPGRIQDCCFWARAARYGMAGGKVQEIRFLTLSLGYFGTPANPR